MKYEELVKSTPSEIMKNLGYRVGISPKERQKREEAQMKR